MESADLQYEALKREWTDQLVEVVPERPELMRFAGLVGRVVTVNHNRKAVIDFASRRPGQPPAPCVGWSIRFM